MARNAVLADLLARLGWSPFRLAKELNKSGMRVDPSTPWQWVNRGTVPGSDAIPSVVAEVLSSALGTAVAAQDIWPALPRNPLESREIREPWTTAGLLGLLRNDDAPSAWVASGPLASDLVGAYENAGAERWRSVLTGEDAPDPELAESIEGTIPLLRRIDDRGASEVHLLYVRSQIDAVAGLVRLGTAPPDVHQRLLRSLSHMAQLAGWTALELGDGQGRGQGRAQRYLLIALRAAHLANDRPLAAHILGDLAYQAATFGRPAEASVFATAAERAVRGASALARACVLGRVAYAHAAAGDATAFVTARGSALDSFSGAGKASDAPWAYYLTQQHLTVQMGYSLIALARSARQAELGGRTSHLLKESAPLMEAAGSQGYGGGRPSSLKAGFELSWVAIGHVHRRDLEAACAAGADALAHYTAAPTARSHRLLSDLAAMLRRRQTNPHVRDFFPHLANRLDPTS